MNESEERRCSFCGKKESQVLKLVGGPGVNICDKCVEVANQIVNDPHGNNEDRDEKKLVLNVLDGLDRLFDRDSGVIDLYALIFATSKAFINTEYSDLFDDAANNLEKIALSQQEDEVKRDQALFVTNHFRIILARNVTD